MVDISQSLAIRGVSLTLGSDQSSNVTAIQTALDQNFLVNVIGSGTFLVNDTLRPGGNGGGVVLSPQTALKMAPGVGKPLIRNKASLATQTPVALTWTTGKLLNVAWVNHGLVVGDYAWIRLVIGQATNAANAPYPGVFAVRSVTDANNFVLEMENVPTAAPTLNYTAVKADTNITVQGLFDYDQANQGAPSAINTQAVVFAGVAGLSIPSITIRNSYKYCLTIGAVVNADIGPVFIPITRSDGVKFYGPLSHIRCKSFFGMASDDFVSLQPREAIGFEQYMLSEGIIQDVDLGTIIVTKCGAGASPLALYGHDSYTLDDIRLTGIKGETLTDDGTQADRGINIRANNGVATGLIGRLQFRGIGLRANLPVSMINVNWKRIELDYQEPRQNGSNVDNGNRSLYHVKPGNDTGGGVGVTSGRQLIVTGIMSDPSYGATTTAYAFRNDATVDETFIDMYIAGHVSLRGYTQGSAATVGRVTFGPNYDGTTDHTATIIGGANIPEIVLMGTFRGPCIVNTQVSTDVTVLGGRFVNSSNGIVRAQGTSVVNFKSVGKRRDAGVDIAVVSGTPTINTLSDEIQFDVANTSIARATGNKLYNTNAAAGTLGSAGNVICLGTAANSWHLLANPALTY